MRSAPSHSSTRQGTRMKSLDAKLASIHAAPGTRDRLHPRRRQGRGHGRGPRGDRRRSRHGPAALAGRLPRPDARDRPPGPGRHHAHEREHERRPDDPASGCSTSSPVTPAVRANDTTDIHVVAGDAYTQAPSRPFRTPTLEQIMSGQADPDGGELAARLRPGALLDHAEQRHRVRRRDARGLQGLPARGRAQGLPPLPRGVRAERPGSAAAGGHRPLHQRRDRPHARRRACKRAGRSSSRSPTTGRR